MKIKNLLLAFLALPLLFVACDDSVDEVEKVKVPTIELTAGEATESTLSFTITTTEATDVTWLAIEASEATPTASEVLANGTKVEANKAVTCTATELKDNTEYTIVAAVKNSSAVDKKEIKMTTLQKSDTPEDPKTTEFTATHINTEFDNSEGYNGYGIMLGDKDFGNSGWGVDGGTYYTFYIIAGSTAGGKLPNGAYTLSSSYEANTIVEDYSYRHQMENGTLKNGMEIFSSAELVISDGKIEAQVVLNRDNSVHHIVFEGDLSVDDGSGNQGGDPDVTLTADKWLWGGSSNYGNKYMVSGEGFSLDVHFPAKYATEDGLAAGEYIWTNTSWWGYNDFENEFTTRLFNIDGVDEFIVRQGSADVAVDGDVYTINLLLSTDNTTYMIEYSGEFTDNSQGGNEQEEDVVLTKIEFKSYNASYFFYEYKLSNDNGDELTLFVNDQQANESIIYSDDTYEWISIGYCGNLGFFSTRDIKIAGTAYTATSGSMVVVTDETTYNMDITIDLLMTVGGSKTFKFSGKIGGNEGGNTPAEPTKLDTPSVSGLVEGNAATISWQAVAGAKDYSVSLNGAFLQTVETPYIVVSGLEYSTTYSVSVVANPADTAVNTASDAGTASFTTDADPNGGGDEPGDGGDATQSFEDWTFEATLDMGALTLTLTDGSHTVGFKLNQISGGTFYINDSGALVAYDVTVNGVATENASGTVSISTNDGYHVVIDAVINGVKYTGMSTNAVV